MKQKLLDELMKVSEEEQKYLDGQGNIERQLYVNEKLEEIDRERLLRRGQLITVRPHRGKRTGRKPCNRECIRACSFNCKYQRTCC